MSLVSTNVVGKPDTGARAFRTVPAWAWVAAGTYILMTVCGNSLLNDSDIYWQIAAGRSIIAQGALPHTDIYSFTRAGASWMSSSWLAQVLYAQAYAVAGWNGVVALAAAAISLATGLLVGMLGRHIAPLRAAALAFLALALSMPHLLARPHVLVMPVMLLWVDGLVQASEARRPPSFCLLAWIALWANFHGSFVFGVALIGPFFIDAMWNASAPQRRSLAIRWIAFGCCALFAACATPYGWDSILAAMRILNLGDLLNIISEWRPADFGHVGLFEICVLVLLAIVLNRGVTFSWPRMLIVVGLVGMALSHKRNVELFAFLVPLVVIAPLTARRAISTHGIEASRKVVLPVILLALALVSVGTGTAVGRWHPAAPAADQSPAAAVDMLQRHGAKRVLNDLPFGGYLIWRKIPVFIDGRAELYGERFGIDYFHALELKDVDRFLAMLSAHDIDATLLTPTTPAAMLLDHLPGWTRVYANPVAVVHMRDPQGAQSGLHK